MSKYDEIVTLAENLSSGTSHQKEVVCKKISNFTGDDFVDVLEISREILVENQNVEPLIMKMNIFLQLVALEYTERLKYR